jgi:hypothetical protein
LAAKNRLCRVGSAENFTTVNQALKAKRDRKLLFERFMRTGYIRQPFCSNISGRSFGSRKNDRFDSRGCELYLPMNFVKELMEHSSIATTAEFYNEVDADHEAKAA